MVKCPVCFNEYDPEKEGSKCPICNYPDIGDIDNTKESKAMLKKLADDYRRKHWANGRVYLKVYSYGFEDGSTNALRCESEDELDLGSTRELEVGAPRWQSEQFARLGGGCELTLRIAQEGMEDSLYTLHTTNPQVRGFWQVALCRKDEEHFALLVGTPEQYSESESFTYPPQEA